MPCSNNTARARLAATCQPDKVTPSIGVKATSSGGYPANSSTGRTSLGYGMVAT